MNTQSKVRVLENYHALDLAIFGKGYETVNVCCPILKEEYVRAKGALISCTIDLYKHVELTPTAVSEAITSAGIQSNARTIAKAARQNSKNRILSETTKKEIRTAIQESFTNSKTKKRSDIKNIIESEIKKIGFSKVIDEILIRTILAEANTDSLKNKKGVLIVKAYKALRENFIKSAMTMLES